MDFQLIPIAAGAPGAPAALAARGPDPLISIPANCVLRRINGLTLIIPPGAMVAVGSCLHASVVGALVGHALFVGTDAAPTPARASIALITGILPPKYDAILAQLEADAGVATSRAQ